jgi:transcriptional regulator with XRE-family HTH domain
MPVLRWSGIADTDAAARIVGPRVRQLRVNRGLTIRSLADRVKISKNTVLRLEQGLPIAESALHRICDSLQTVLPNLLEPIPSEDDIKVKVYRAGSNEHRIAFRRTSAPKRYVDFEVIDDPAERLRIGSLGFVSGFVETHGSTLPGGRLQAAIMELWGDQEQPGFRHSGEEFVYCMEGQLRLTVAGEAFLLYPGDSAIFWSRYRHRYESNLPPSAKRVTRMMMVWNELPEDPSSREKDDECEDYE